MANKDIHEWLLDEGIDSLTTILNIKGESVFVVDVLEKHLKEQLPKPAIKKYICDHDWSEIGDMVFMCDKCGMID